MVNTGKKVLATIVFWACAFFGGLIPMLWNAISPHFAQYRQGDLGYYILEIVANAIGAAIGIWAYNSITEETCENGLMINCVIAATVIAMLIIFSFLLNSYTITGILSLVLETAVYVFRAASIQKSKKSSEETK